VVELKGERSLIPPGFAVGGALRFRERHWRSAWRIRPVHEDSKRVA
jgi:hypothetical protein